VQGGQDPILLQSGQGTIDTVLASQGYGSGNFHIEADAWTIINSSADQPYPGTPPVDTSGFSGNWATSTSYTANTSFVVNDGWLWQAITSGTSASSGSGPQATTYGSSTPDGTGALTWKMVCPVGYSLILLDSNSQETKITSTDITGAAYYGLSMQNTLSATAPFDISLTNDTLGDAFVAQLYAHDGSRLFMTGNHVGEQGYNGGQQMEFLDNFTGLSTFSGNLFFGNNSGLAVNAATGANYTFTGNAFGAMATAISFPNAAALHSSITGNTFDSVTTAVDIAAGSSDYQITGNSLNGAALTYTATDSTINVFGNGVAATVTDVTTFATGALKINGGSATAGLATVTAGGVISSEASPSGGLGNALFGTTSGNTSGDVVTMSNTTVGVQDSGTLLSSLAPKASPSFTGTAAAVNLTTSGFTQITSNTYPTTGAGLELAGGAAGFVQAYNRTGAAWIPITLAGSTVTISPEAGSTVNITGLASSAGTNPLCYTVSGGLVTYSTSCTASDETLKNIDQRITGALDKLLRIDGFYFTWKDPDKYGAGKQIGVGAQTVERVFPELVSTGSDGIKSVAYDKLAAPIIEAMRELKVDNDNLRACQNNWKCRLFGVAP
jgi:hypothetical protein